MVAPLVGAWIEIEWLGSLGRLGWVAPLVGAWIEIVLFYGKKITSLGRTPRGCVD